MVPVSGFYTGVHAPMYTITPSPGKIPEPCLRSTQNSQFILRVLMADPVSNTWLLGSAHHKLLNFIFIGAKVTSCR